MHAGGLLDYDAVKAGLESGHIGGLGLDVQWQEPFDPQDWIALHPRCAGLSARMQLVTHLPKRLFPKPCA